ncbi:MAG: site-specific DNA-methyltransferase [Verrucomicrobia bacterium]|nr:site-specific DNA-methyltransferase [Verrucomicrobiota bacterium]
MSSLASIVGTIQPGDARSFMAELPDASFDVVVCDGPYAVTTHDWDDVPDIQHFNLDLLKSFARLLKPGGAVYLFGKPDCVDFVDYRPFLTLQSKIAWYQPSRLAQGRVSYTNNYDVICYFTKGKARTFNLEDIRVPQLVELEHRLRCERVPSVTNGKFGKTVFNPNGKNPGDVWGDIKQLTYKSRELVSREMLNTIQKPEKLMERLIKASSNPGDLVFDPFCGSGTVPVVCQRLGRRFVACEINPEYRRLAEERLPKAANGSEAEDELFTEAPTSGNGRRELAQAGLL